MNYVIEVAIFAVLRSNVVLLLGRKSNRSNYASPALLYYVTFSALAVNIEIHPISLMSDEK